MHRTRLLFLLGLALAVGATSVAKGQDRTSDLDQPKTVDQDAKHSKAKKSDDSHRKHWYSLPHLRHKKNDGDSDARKTATSASSKPAATRSVNKTAAASHPGNKTAGTTKAGQKTVAGKGQGTRAAAGTSSGRKTAASTSHGKKSVRHNCTAEEAKKGGCQAAKGHGAKGTTSHS